MSTTGNLPLLFGSVLAGALVIKYGTDNVKSAFASSPSSSSTGSSATAAPATNLPSGGQRHGLVSLDALTAIGKTHGWSPAQIADWMKVIMAESNGTLTDTNPSSGAYGIAQFINGPGEYAKYGGSSTTLTGQLTAMANYIAQRYGNPSNAWAHERANHWY